MWNLKDNMERNYTDEQILNEARAIMQNTQLRYCKTCHHWNERHCHKLGKEVPSFQYAGMCKYYETNEEKILRESREAIERLEHEERKLNHLLTLSLNSIESAMLFLEDFSSRVEKEYRKAEQKGIGDAKSRRNDREWISKLSRSYKQMHNLIEGARRQYSHFIEPQLNKVFMDKETGTYDAASYDDHMSDAFEIAKLVFMYFDKAYNNAQNAEAVFNLLSTLQGCGVMEEKDFKKYDFKR